MKKERTNCPICGRFVSKGLAEKYESLKLENETLEKSNKWMEESLERLRADYKDLHEEYLMKDRELARLKNRGFFARLFNK